MRHRRYLRDFEPKSNCNIEGWGLAAAAVVAAGAVGSAVISSDASKSAAQTQANAAQNATTAELSMFDKTQANLAPYMNSGTNALASLNYGLGVGPKSGASAGSGAYGSLTAPFTAADYTASPGYAWQMSQGIDAVQNSASAAGGIGGGNTLKGLTTFGQGLANSDYQQAYQNYLAQQQQRYGMLSNTAGSGQNAAAGLGAIGTTVGGQVGGNIIGAGNALAAGQIGSANAVTGGINSLAQLSALYGNGGANTNPYNLGGFIPQASPGGTLQYDQWGNIISGGSVGGTAGAGLGPG
jgi:hypothetical protein